MRTSNKNLHKINLLILGISFTVCNSLKALDQPDKPDCSQACERAGRSSYSKCVERNFSLRQDCLEFGRWVEKECNKRMQW